MSFLTEIAKANVLLHTAIVALPAEPTEEELLAISRLACRVGQLGEGLYQVVAFR